MRDSGTQPGYTSLPGAEMGMLIQPFVQYPGSPLTTAGEAWRQVRNHWIIPYGGALLLIAALAIGLFYWRRGPHRRPPARHRPQDRALHATSSARPTGASAITFVVLAVSGLVMAFGKFFLLPIIGGHAVRLADATR